MSRDDEAQRWRWLVGLLLATLSAALVYSVHRSFVLRVDQWDAFLYLNNALRFLGVTEPHYQLDKPPLVPALYMPVVALTRDVPASDAMLVAPHLHATLLSFLAMGAVFLSMRGPLGWRLALVGTVLTVGNRIFMRYAPLALTDIVAAGFVACSFWLWWEARRRRRFSLFVLAGVSVGLAAATRYQFAMIPFAIGAAELAIGLKERRIYDRRWLGLTICAGLSGLVFLYAHKLAFEAIGREASIGSLMEAIEYAGAGARRQYDHEEPWHYLQMLSVVMSPLTLLSAVLGFGVAAHRRRDREPFFEEDVVRGTAAWLLENTAEGTPYYWYGRPHTLHPDDVERLVHDEFFNVFNFGAHEFIYFTGRPMFTRPFAGLDPTSRAIREAPNGCGIIVGTQDDFNTHELLEAGVPDPPVHVIAIRRVNLARSERGYAGEDLSFRGTAGGVIPDGDYGELYFAQANGAPRVVRDVRRDSPIDLRLGDGPLIAYRVRRAAFPLDE